MRLCVEFSSAAPVALPWDYPHHLHGMLVQAILEARPQLDKLLHGQGFQVEGHRYRLLTASWLFAERFYRTPESLVFVPPIRWWVSSPLSALMEALSVTLLVKPERRLAAALLMVSTVRVEPMVAFEGQAALFRTISPIVVSTVELRPDGKRYRRFLSPEDAAFWRNLEQNLRRKAQGLYGDGQQFGPLAFRTVTPGRSRLVTVQGTNVRGWELEFWIWGDPVLIALGYEAGFGERNQQCFGMVRLLRTGKPPAELEQHEPGAEEAPSSP
ncbi:hypothetical protein HRbin21_00454 [bacterium HR21]|nr:hypothetical protein HRbin21_00454 [bacterium HR21]